MSRSQQQAFFYSGGMHLALLIFAIFGLPDLFSDYEEPEVIEIVLADDIPISDKRNAPNVTPTPPKKDMPKKQTEAPTAKPTPPKPKQEVETVKIPDKKAEPEPKKEKKPEKETPQVDPLDSVLKDLAEDAREAPVVDVKKPIHSTANYDPSQPMSRTETDAIIKQIADNWTVLAGAKDDYTLAVKIKVKLLPDGTVQFVTLSPDDQARANRDPVFRAAATRALQAVRKSSPIKNLPTDKYATWKDMELNFDPRNLLY